MRILINPVVSVSLVLLLAACGPGDESQPPNQPSAAAPATSATQAKPKSQKTEATAAEARAGLRCPATITTPAREPGQAVDDVLGLRPGMSYAEAQASVLCSDEMLVVKEDRRAGFQIQTFGQTVKQGFSAHYAEARVQRTSQEIMQEMQNNAMARSMNKATRESRAGTNRWQVGTMGMPGEERVINVAREEWFAPGGEPTLDTVEQALVEKYGQPSDKQDAGSSRHYDWIYDPYGRLVTETSPLYRQCRASPSPDAGINITPDCGVVIAARTDGLQDNPQLTASLSVAVVAMADAYESLKTTEQALLDQENQRQAQQVQDANQNAAKPKL